MTRYLEGLLRVSERSVTTMGASCRGIIRSTREIGSAFDLPRARAPLDLSSDVSLVEKFKVSA
jgi:hypothetical protein